MVCSWDTSDQRNVENGGRFKALRDSERCVINHQRGHSCQAAVMVVQGRGIVGSAFGRQMSMGRAVSVDVVQDNAKVMVSRVSLGKVVVDKRPDRGQS